MTPTEQLEHQIKVVLDALSDEGRIGDVVEHFGPWGLALRAVLELHKPTEPHPNTSNLFCTHCWEEPVYPCATVRAISSALEAS